MIPMGLLRAPYSRAPSKGRDIKVRRFCLEKPYPAVLKKVFEQEGGLIVFADFAGRIAPLISELNQGRNLTLILDHHVAEASTDPEFSTLTRIYLD